MLPNLFDDVRDVRLAPGAVLLGGFALADEDALVSELHRVVEAAPFRHMLTPGGQRMSVAMSNCGPLGWISDGNGYRYEACDPLSGRPWPPMPAIFQDVAARAAARAGFPEYAPDACLINRYVAGARLSLHQDRDEQDLQAPIVSVSLGVPATFLFGGFKRADATQRIALRHGDVVVWGGPSRVRYHGVLPLDEGEHPLMGACRINLTFRKTI